MGTSYQKPGEVLQFTAPTGGVTKGVPVLIGALPVVPLDTVAQTLPFRGYTQGVHLLPKASGQTWSEGSLLYLDNSAHNVTTTSTSNYRLGVATAAAASGDTTGYVRLNGQGVPSGA